MCRGHVCAGYFALRQSRRACESNPARAAADADRKVEKDLPPVRFSGVSLGYGMPMNLLHVQLECRPHFLVRGVL